MMDFETRLNERLLEQLHNKFVKDANPLHVWQAYQWVRQFGLPVPDWVMAYLDQVANVLVTPRKDKDVKKLAVKALGLATKGGHGKHQQIANARRDTGIFSILDFCLSLTPDDLSDHEPKPAWLSDQRLRGDGRLEMLCEHIAAETQRPDNKLSDRPLSAKTIRALYFRRKRRS
jgi:hypothetical protein